MKYPLSDVFFSRIGCLGFPFRTQRSLLSLLYLTDKFNLKKNTGASCHHSNLYTQLHFLFLLQILFLLIDACYSNSWSFCPHPVLLHIGMFRSMEDSIIWIRHNPFSHVWTFRSFLIFPFTNEHILYGQCSVGSILS